MPKLLHPHLALRFQHADRTEHISELRSRKTDQRWPLRRHIALERHLFDQIARGHGAVCRLYHWMNRRAERRWRKYRVETPYLHSSATLSSAWTMPLSE